MAKSDWAQDIANLVEGYEDFKQTYFSGDSDLFKHLSKGQSPKVLLIACADSRVTPNVLLNAQPGDLFVLRNVANLVPAYQSSELGTSVRSGIEYAVKALGVSHIIVKGHSQCGGIRALMDPQGTADNFETILPWVEIAKGAREQVKKDHPDMSAEEQACVCERLALLTSIHNLRTYPWVKAAEQAGKLHLHAWHFDFNSGVIEAFDQSSQAFKALEAPAI